MRRLLTCILAVLPLAGQVSTPRLTIDADGATSMKLYRGRPLFVNGLLSHSVRANTAAPIVIAPEGSGWTDGLKLVVVNSSGQELSWLLTPLGTAQSIVLTLPPKGSVPMAWMLASSATAELERGAYTLSLVLSINNSSGWNGSARSAPVVVEVEDEPAERNDSELRQLGLLRAREARIAGSASDELNILIDLWVKSPKDVSVLTALAHAFEAFGAPPAVVLRYVEAAIQAFFEAAGPGQDPPPGLMEYRARLRAPPASVIP